MEKVLTRSPKFEWQHYDISELRKEYYSIGLADFMKKYKTGRGSVFHWLGYIPDHLKVKQVPVRKNKTKLEIFENTTKVARMYEQKMKKLKAPKYEGPWSNFIKS